MSLQSQLDQNCQGLFACHTSQSMRKVAPKLGLIYGEERCTSLAREVFLVLRCTRIFRINKSVNNYSWPRTAHVSDPCFHSTADTFRWPSRDPWRKKATRNAISDAHIKVPCCRGTPTRSLLLLQKKHVFSASARGKCGQIESNTLFRMQWSLA